MDFEYDESSKLLLETKENLTRLRAITANFSFRNDQFTDFEKAYGKYLYVPFDVPVVAPLDKQQFLDFFFQNAQMTRKIKTDLVSLEEDPVTPYKQITSVSRGQHADVWSAHQVPEIYEKFPEIFEQIYDNFPFVNREDFKWSMWSSTKHVPAHRDYGPQIDAPISIRIMLHDDNPMPTLSLKLDPIDSAVPAINTVIKLPNSTNTFAWNNLRQKHKSIFIPKHKKILMILSAKESGKILSAKKSFNQYIDLLDRSIVKYKDMVAVDTVTNYTDYLTFTESDTINNILEKDI
jgi:hypothetical protein